MKMKIVHTFICNDHMLVSANENHQHSRAEKKFANSKSIFFMKKTNFALQVLVLFYIFGKRNCQVGPGIFVS
jgi:hypothetical protein